MKRYLCLFFLCLGFTLSAQTLDDVGRISIMVSKPTDTSIPEEARSLLETRMHQFVSSCGIVDNGFDRRFELSSNVQTLSKDIVGGAPARVSQKIEITFLVRDIVENKTYAQVPVELVGVGLNENKAFIMAFNNLKQSNAKVIKMIETAKELIITYYRTQIDKILQNARFLADKGSFDEALYNLALVPDVCTDAYDKCQETMIQIYQEKIDHEGLILLRQAKAAWAESPDAAGATQATSLLSQINILAACQEEIDPFLNEITEKVKDDQRKAWEFQLQQYADNKAREQRNFEFKVRQYEDSERKAEQRHQEELAREQRDFDFSVYRFKEEMGFKHAIVDASKEVALVAAKAIR